MLRAEVKLTAIDSCRVNIEGNCHGAAAATAGAGRARSRSGQTRRSPAGRERIRTSHKRSDCGRITPSQVDGAEGSAVGLRVLLGKSSTGWGIFGDHSNETVGVVLDGGGKRGIGGAGGGVGACCDTRVEVLEEGERGARDVQGPLLCPHVESIV